MLTFKCTRMRQVKCVVLVVGMSILSVFLLVKHKGSPRPEDSPSTDPAQLNENITEIVKAYSPRIFLHSKEKFYPSDVNYFLANVQLVDKADVRAYGQPEQLTSSNLPTVNSKDPVYMISKDGSFSSHCDRLSCQTPEFAGGQNITASFTPPTYAIVVRRNISTIDIIYWVFYPWNEGTTICVGLRLPYFGCLGRYETYGYHLGDWEHVTVRLVNCKSVALVLSAHSLGMFSDFAWNGEIYEGSAGTVKVVGTHPIVYSSIGTHAFRAFPGQHPYTHTLPNFESLLDYTDSGVAWDTWKNVTYVTYNTSGYTGENSWLNFYGFWGTKDKDCAGIVPFLSGICGVSRGPLAPGFSSVTTDNSLS